MLNIQNSNIMDFDNPQQVVVDLDGITFFSNFDSGNLAKAFVTGLNEVVVI